MIELLKEVGRGKRGARDLALDEAREAARLILHGEATPAQIGAFLVAERVKTESVEELQAFVEGLRESAVRPAEADGAEHPRGTANGSRTAGLRLDCAGPYDGRRKSFFASWPAAFLLAEAGLDVTLHGSGTLPPKRGITLHDMFLVRGIDMDRVSLERLSRAARETGVRYAPAERLCPPLARLRPIREQLGLRTMLNTAEKLVDYGRSDCLLLGIFHHTVAERYGRLLSRLGYRRAAIVQGMEGSEDLFIDRPTNTWLAEPHGVVRNAIDPVRAGLRREVPETDWTAERQMETAELVLAGKAHPAFVHMTVLNAAYRLQLAGQAGDLPDGIHRAQTLLDSGKPLERWEKWKSILLSAAE